MKHLIIALIVILLIQSEAFAPSKILTQTRSRTANIQAKHLSENDQTRRATPIQAKQSAQNEQTSNDSNSNDDDSPQLVQTLGGGTQLIFEMARRMLVWDEKPADNGPSLANKSSSSRPLPRWHPHAGISDVNPSFRTQAPIMNNQGYARAIWRNVRKREKPSLWRHALRTYDRMLITSSQQQRQQAGSSSSALKVKPTNTHHEGALLACAKLGLWQEGIRIYHRVEQTRDKYAGGSSPASTTSKAVRAKRTFVTHEMVLSLIKACVKGSKKLSREAATLEERRAPLDAAKQILLTIEQEHQLPLEARYLNPLAAAYQSLGLLPESRQLLQDNLAARITGPESEHYGEKDPLNINDFSAKDKGSYALLVKSAVATRDWAQAVNALQDMTEAGLYPNPRHLNSWTEVSERKKKQRTTRSWKKKRDEYWLESVR